MQVRQETHVVVAVEEFQERLGAVLGAMIGGDVTVDAVAYLVDDEDDYRYRGTVTFGVSDEQRGTLATKLDETSHYADTVETVRAGNGVELDGAMIQLALGLPVLHWTVSDVSRHTGRFTLDVVVAQVLLPGGMAVAPALIGA